MKLGENKLAFIWLIIWLEVLNVWYIFYNVLSILLMLIVMCLVSPSQNQHTFIQESLIALLLTVLEK